jgi:hypothetical protein
MTKVTIRSTNGTRVGLSGTAAAPTSFRSLTDVNANDIQDGQLLQWDAATQKLIPASVPAPTVIDGGTF